MSGMLAPLLAAALAATAPSIAYERFEGVATIKPDGSGDRVIVKHADSPTWSPDRTRLAFVLKNAIWTARADGSDRRRVLTLARGLPFDPAWSPDGKRIAYVQYTETPRPGADDGEVDEHHTVFTVRTDGGGRRLVHEGDAPAWTPTGNHIVVASGGNLGIVKPEGTGYRRLVRSDSFISDIAVSRNGRRIAYVQSLGTTAIGVYDRSTGRNRLLVKDDRTALIDIAWTPDGGRMAWIEHPIRRSGTVTTRLYTARPDGSGRTALFAFPAGSLTIDALAW
jgi:dipeptidyl aminopeptidase/acylaminoacyl peptidase